jgi:hypothetical protein
MISREGSSPECASHEGQVKKANPKDEKRDEHGEK